MNNVARRAAAAVALAALSGCFGGKAPKNLITLSATAPDPGPVARSAQAGEAVTIEAPVVAKELRTTRVAAQSGTSTVAYIKDLTLVDTPDKLMKDLIQETVLRTTTRVVLDQKQSTLDPGLVVTGRLTNFGYEAGAGQVLVRYDAALSASGGTRVETRRFEARAPADGTALSVGAGLNAAANDVALQVAKWIGG